ncbi:FKBP-type peptidyl-prolyl cis-trans isomerase [Streptomyces griseus]|uniref:peptidylprolyl isomerase n=1 Tax=Streptomyces stephensoniae TaxID=3375367 RepID=A0ABU2VYN0_9ACTN|nr:FKBP-type peptidyl-prolyl cis-trans isomerase [Streptomyces griseus]MDT0490363.1 FKBP-type peptidyl-prolyl cis-trans isomerase [Streptomyces griseus]
MNPTKTARRAAAALVVPALLFTAACGGSDSKDTDAQKSGAVAKVSGKFGAEPKIDVPDDAKASDDVVVSEVLAGKGAEVKKGDTVRLDYAGNIEALGSTWAQRPGTDAKAPRTQIVQEIGQAGAMLPSKITDALAGQKVGSRVQIEGTAQGIVGDQLNPDLGIKPTDPLIWVIDIVNAKKIDKKAEAKGDQAASEAGMPEVKAPSQKAATITIPKGEKAPKDLQQQVLIKGEGAEVKAGEGLVVQYTGVKWEDGKKFDSSWDNNGATVFPIGVNAVIEGWDKALVGKNVGDRVLLTIPPNLAYGASPTSELAKNNLVFVVDILDTI